jgi:HPt (histidine-containing phosphotransfer) domain-containing protein
MPAKSSPLISSLPTDDEEFCEIVHLFVDRLNDKLGEMHKFLADHSFSELAAHAHWLKGSGGMAGFVDFTEPARKLELLAKNEQFDEIDDALQDICDLAQRIEPPQLQTIGSSQP